MRIDRRHFALLLPLAILSAAAVEAGEPIEQPAFAVKILSLENAGKDVLGQTAVAISVEVTNKSGRTAKLINAQIVIRDVLDNQLARFNWQHNRGIESGKSRKMSDEYSSMLGGGGLLTLLETDGSLLKAEFHVYKAAWADGEIVEYDQCLFCDF